MWTDAFQMLIVFTGIVAVLWKGTEEVGGFSVVWETARNGSKLQADKCVLLLKEICISVSERFVPNITY